MYRTAAVLLEEDGGEAMYAERGPRVEVVPVGVPDQEKCLRQQGKKVFVDMVNVEEINNG
jgi:hypothetical protein